MLTCLEYLRGTKTWEQRKLGELVDVCSGRDYKHLSEGTIPVYGTGGYECQLESEPRARLILSHLCSFESEPPKHRSSNDPDGRSPHSYLGHRI